jgi:hypothetical protein
LKRAKLKTVKDTKAMHVAAVPRIKPRNPLVVLALQKKAGAHRRKDQRAERARQRESLRKSLAEES